MPVHKKNEMKYYTYFIHETFYTLLHKTRGETTDSVRSVVERAGVIFTTENSRFCGVSPEVADVFEWYTIPGEACSNRLGTPSNIVHATQVVEVVVEEDRLLTWPSLAWFDRLVVLLLIGIF